MGLNAEHLAQHPGASAAKGKTKKAATAVERSLFE
jgi:hypothetical protein